MRLRILLLAGAFSGPVLGQGSLSIPESQLSARVLGLGRSFLDNRERWPKEPCFIGSASGMRVGIVRDAILLQVFDAEADRMAVVRLGFEGASESVELEPLEPRPGRFNFFVGKDPSKWRRNLRRYGAVRWSELYPGVDLVLRSEEEGYEYDLLVAPGADLSRVILRCEGIESLELDETGCAVLETPLGAIRQVPGRCWQEDPEGRIEELAFMFRVLDGERLGFEVPERDPSLFLTIDPELVWSTYLGGKGGGPSLGDVARAVALDDAGNVTVTGTSEGGVGDGQFPMTPGTFQAASFSNGTDIFGEDVFVTRFRQSDGTLIYSSVIGGGMSHEDRAQAIDVDGSGRAVVAGHTPSEDFPTTPGAWDTTFSSNAVTAFVFRLSPNGDDLEFSTFLEGNSNGGEAYAVAALDSGSTLVAGRTTSPSFPTTPGAFDTTHNGFDDAFITQFDPTGSSLEWSTFLGGFSLDRAQALELEPQGTVLVTGLTGSSDFPITSGAFDTTLAPFGDVFVTRLDPSGSQVLLSTFLGGSMQDMARAIAVDRNGSVYVAGDTTSTDFPTTPGSFQPVFIPGVISGLPEAFLTRFDSTGSSLVYSTFLGGCGSEGFTGLKVDASGLVSGTGFVQGPFTVTPGAFDDSNGAGKDTDGFVSRFDPTGSKLFYSSRLGGTQVDALAGIAMNTAGRVTVAGQTISQDYPTTSNAFQPTFGAGGEAVVTTMDLVLRGVDLIGSSNPSCLGAVMLNATEMPVQGAASFGFYCSAAPPLARGWLLVGFSNAQSPFALARNTGPALPTPLSILPVQSDAAGYAEIPLPLKTGTQGLVFSARCFFKNPSTCLGPMPFSSSNGLLITVQ